MKTLEEKGVKKITKWKHDTNCRGRCRQNIWKTACFQYQELPSDFSPPKPKFIVGDVVMHKGRQLLVKQAEFGNRGWYAWSYCLENVIDNCWVFEKEIAPISQ